MWFEDILVCKVSKAEVHHGTSKSWSNFSVDWFKKSCSSSSQKLGCEDFTNAVTPCSSWSESLLIAAAVCFAWWAFLLSLALDNILSLFVVKDSIKYCSCSQVGWKIIYLLFYVSRFQKCSLLCCLRLLHSLFEWTSKSFLGSSHKLSKTRCGFLDKWRWCTWFCLCFGY